MAPGGRSKEDVADLEGALVEYERDGLYEDALRIALILADAEAEPASRLKRMARALRIAAQTGEVPRSLQVRYACTKLDVLRAHGVPQVWELLALGKDLEALGEHAAAADAFGLAGDRQAQARMLAASGELERLEGMLDEDNARLRAKRQRAQTLADVAALDASGQRIRALDAARALLTTQPHDEEVKTLADSLTTRLVAPPVVTLETAEGRVKWVLSEEAVVGRADCEMPIASPLISRRHLRFSRAADGTSLVEDLGSRNGTTLAGARLAAPLEVRGPLTLSLGGELACVVTPRAEGGLWVTLAGERWALPLSTECSIGTWRLQRRASSLRLLVPDGAPAPVLSERLRAGEGVDLCKGDVIASCESGPVVLRVLP